MLVQRVGLLMLVQAAVGALMGHGTSRVGSTARPLASRHFAPLMVGSFRYTGKVRPGQQSPMRTIPNSITRPDYADDGKPKARGPVLPWQVEVKSAKDIEGMRKAGRIAREVLDAAGRIVAPGITTEQIDILVTEETIKRGAYPSPLNYHRFPKSCCTSVNEVPIRYMRHLTSHALHALRTSCCTPVAWRGVEPRGLRRV